MIPLPVETLASKAQLIIQGKVLGSTVQRDAGGRIYTAVELQVDEVWKGTLATNRFTIVHGGGTLGDTRLEVSGQVEYALEEEVVSFLVLNAQGQGITIGLSQGKFHVWQDSATGEKLVQNRFHGRQADAPKAAAGNLTRSGIHSRLTLADLKQLANGGAK